MRDRGKLRESPVDRPLCVCEVENKAGSVVMHHVTAYANMREVFPIIRIEEFPYMEYMEYCDSFPYLKIWDDEMHNFTYNFCDA